jgi:RNA-directed DNA polymerase
MSSNARLKVLALPALTQAWTDLLHNTKPLSRNTSGVDGVSVNDFAQNPKHFLLQLSRELAQNRFRFSELRAVLIKKPNGKDRLIFQQSGIG